MKRKAIDIALLLPPRVDKQMLTINQSLEHGGEHPQVRDFRKTLAHITLAFAVIDENDLGTIKKEFSLLLAKHKQLELTQYYINKKGSLGQSNDMVIEDTPELLALHKDIMDMLLPYEQGKVGHHCFSEKVDPITFTRIDKHRSSSSYENFYPHITLGLGYPQIVGYDERFVVDRVAICSVGNFCSCVDILWEEKLQ